MFIKLLNNCLWININLKQLKVIFPFDKKQKKERWRCFILQPSFIMLFAIFFLLLLEKKLVKMWHCILIPELFLGLFMCFYFFCMVYTIYTVCSFYSYFLFWFHLDPLLLFNFILIYKLYIYYIRRLDG